MTTATATTREVECTVDLLGRLFANTALENVAFRLWDGSAWPDEKPRAATIVLKHPDAVRAMFAPGTEKGLAEAFLRDDFDVEGDIESACELADAFAERVQGGWRWATRLILRSRLGPPKPLLRRAWGANGTRHVRRHTLDRDRDAIAFHYDLSNDFFRLWLDSRMLYSCAYFERPTDDLEAAQLAKMRHLCRKLRLQERQRLLDIGCGWGGLAMFAAQQHRARVTGITLSEQQASLASTRVAEAGLSRDVEFERKDYRELSDKDGFDAIVSVGMQEHVGRECLAAYFKQAYALLKPGGVFLNHAIGEGVCAPEDRGPSFIQEYVFPDSDIPPLSRVLVAAEEAGFEIRDVENLREHYALTLRRWVQRLEANHAAALKFVNEETYRVWRLYLAGSAHGFDRGRLAVYQTLLVKPDAQGRANLPLTRRDWYERA